MVKKITKKSIFFVGLFVGLMGRLFVSSGVTPGPEHSSLLSAFSTPIAHADAPVGDSGTGDGCAGSAGDSAGSACGSSSCDGSGSGCDDGDGCA